MSSFWRGWGECLFVLPVVELEGTSSKNYSSFQSMCSEFEIFSIPETRGVGEGGITFFFRMLKSAFCSWVVNIFRLHKSTNLLSIYLLPNNTIISADLSGSTHPNLVATLVLLYIISNYTHCTLFLTVTCIHVASIVLESYLFWKLICSIDSRDPSFLAVAQPDMHPSQQRITINKLNQEYSTFLGPECKSHQTLCKNHIVKFWIFRLPHQ